MTDLISLKNTLKLEVWSQYIILFYTWKNAVTISFDYGLFEQLDLHQ